MHNLRKLAHPPSPQSRTQLPWPPCPTPVSILQLASHLHYHPDTEFARFVLQGMSQGFHVGYSLRSGGLRSSFRNHPSSMVNCQVVSRYEVAAGCLFSPLTAQIWDDIHCSPISLMPGGRNTEQWRMNVDLSYQGGRSVNDGIAKPLCSLQYSSADDAVQFIEALGQYTYLIKLDLKSAYRLVPIHPQDRYLLEIRWRDQVYLDKAHPFSLCLAPILFTRWLMPLAGPWLGRAHHSKYTT